MFCSFDTRKITPMEALINHLHLRSVPCPFNHCLTSALNNYFQNVFHSGLLNLIHVSLFGFPAQCSVHGEHYIMFSTVRKTMLCINCYRDTAMEARLHCVDLDTAYSQGCRKLDRAVMVGSCYHSPFQIFFLSPPALSPLFSSSCSSK